MGSTPSEQNPYITGVPGHEILKRVNRLQSFNYGISFQQQDAITLGKSTPTARQKGRATVDIELNYITDGISNENRIGFYTENQSTSESKNLFYDFADVGRKKDQRNLYVCTTNDGGGDIRDQSLEVPNVSGTLLIHDYIHNQSKDFNVMSFQNCYTTSHSIAAEVGSVATTSVGLQSNNVVIYTSGSGVHIPDLNLKSGVVVSNNKKIIIPRHFAEANTNVTNQPKAFTQGDITVDILESNPPAGDESIKFQNQVIQTYSANTTLPRESLDYVGNKLPSDKPLVFPVVTECSISLLNSGLSKGNLADNLDTNSDYNLVVKFKNGSDVILRHVLSGAKLTDSAGGQAIGGQTTSNLRFSCPNDFENNAKGLFVSGSMVTFSHQIIDSSGNFVVNNSNQKISQEFFPPF